MRLFFLTPTIGMKSNVKNNQTNEFIYSTLGGTSSTMSTYPSRSTGAYATHSAASSPLELYDQQSALVELKLRILKANVL